MREFPIKFDEGITRGLRPYAKMPRNYQLLTDAVNFRVTKRGPEVPPIIVTPASWAALGTVWPYPKVFRTGHQYFLINASTLYAIDPGTLDIGSSVELQIDSWAYPSSAAGFWTLADFGDFAIFCDGGEYAIYYLRALDYTSSSAICYIGKFTGRGPRALCNFRQELLIGGTGTGVYQTGWSWPPMKRQWRNVVFWGPIGSITGDDSIADVMSGSGYSMLAVVHLIMRSMVGKPTGGNGSVYAVPFQGVPLGGGAMTAEDTISQFGWGFMPMRYNGYVWNLKPMHSAVISYGSNGIAALIPYTSPTPTYGYKHLADFGIAGPAAVAGDENKHIFVNEFGDLWRLKNDLSLEKLGYSEYIAPLLTSQYDSGAGGYKIVVSHDTLLDDFYISNGVKTYLLTEDGLSEIKLWHPTSLFREKGVLYGVTTAGSSTAGSLASDTLDLGIRGIKLISSLEIGGDATSLEAGVDYRYASGNAYSSGLYKPVTRTGQVMPLTGGVDFKIKLRNADYTRFNPDYINIRWKPVDKRVIRGPYEASHGKAVS